eukprot:SAG11_NODE_589_length_8326_cov_11.644099_8_plen_90_part_00
MGKYPQPHWTGGNGDRKASLRQKGEKKGSPSWLENRASKAYLHIWSVFLTCPQKTYEWTNTRNHPFRRATEVVYPHYPFALDTRDPLRI